MLVPQPLYLAQYNSCKHTNHWGWFVKSCSLDVSTYVAGPLQPSQERYDFHAHMFTSYVSWDYRGHMNTKNPMHNPTRKLPTRARKETRDLVLSLWLESPRKLTPWSIASSARSMGARILRTTGDIVVSMRKTGWRKPISVPPRKTERNPIP